jgi:hypothetical protein
MNLQIHNYGPDEFSGWIRTVTDFYRADPVAMVDPTTGTYVVPGGVAGHGRWYIDVLVRIGGQSRIEIPWDRFRPMRQDVLDTLAADINVEEIRQRFGADYAALDGAAVLLRSERFYDGVKRWTFIRYYAGDAHAVMEGVAVAAREGGAEMVPHLPAGWSTYLQTIHLQRYRLADGQGMAWSALLFDAHALLTRGGAERARLVGEFQVHAQALQALFSGGTGWPLFVGDVAEWVNRHSRCWQVLAGWDRGTLGPEKDVSGTGAQEDQLFVGGEGKVPGAWVPRYWAALGTWRHPCHVLHLDGSWPDPDRDFCAYHLGRPRASYGGNTTLGRTTWPSKVAANGWANGADPEHWLLGNLYAVLGLAATPAGQLQARFHAMAWLFSCTVREGLTTTRRAGTAREFGYKCWVAFQLWHMLDDRDLAERIRQRVLEWLPQAADAMRRKVVNGWWDPREDSRLGPGKWAMAWQQVLGGWAGWRLGRLFNLDELAEWAHDAMVFAYTQALGGGTRPAYAVQVDGPGRDMGDSDWTHYAFPLAWGHGPDAAKANPRATDRHNPGKWQDPMQ